MRKIILFLFAWYACEAATEGDVISFNIIYLDSTGRLFFTYPASLPSHKALSELQKNFIKQKFGEKFLTQDAVIKDPAMKEPVMLLNLYKKQNEDIEIMSDMVSFPMPGIVQFSTSSYLYVGGSAHGLESYAFGLFSLADGKRIEFNSMFNKGWEKDVTKLIIKEYLLSLNVQLLADYNYTQKESDFIPETAKFSDKGVEFVFPVYKIAPYGAGEQSVFLPWNTLKPYLNKKSIIYRKLKF